MNIVTNHCKNVIMAIGCKHCRKNKKEDTGEEKKGGSGDGRLVGDSVGLDLFVLLKLGKRLFILDKGKKNKGFKKQYCQYPSKQIS